MDPSSGPRFRARSNRQAEGCGCVGDMHLAKIQGDSGAVRLRAALAGIRIPGPRPDLLAAAPVQITAEMRLDRPDRPIRFSLAHPVITADGEAVTAGTLQGKLKLNLRTWRRWQCWPGSIYKAMRFVNLTAAIRRHHPTGCQRASASPAGGPRCRPWLVTQLVLRVGRGKPGSNVTVSRFEIDGRKIKASAVGSRGRRQLALRLAARSARPDKRTADPGRCGPAARPGERTGRRSCRDRGPLGNARANRQARGTDQREGAFARPPRQTCRLDHRAGRAGGISARIGGCGNPRRRRRAGGRDRACRLEERPCPRDACPGSRRALSVGRVNCGWLGWMICVR